ncbi:MAG: S49 family peptidase [Ardenticatenaceae bacterium]|nr:S49 family peptidase [Anaerolineales bacterium]MCB8920107.1 S49 family peptidase [Ardenticatenaceae bacterium]MCB8991800.1 S49 family peptidase [Ardenticatenaceae bacterium]
MMTEQTSPPPENDVPPSFLQELGHEIKNLFTTLGNEWAALGVSLRNQMRLARHAQLDYVLLPIGGPLPERQPPPRGFIQRQLPLPPLPLSMEVLNGRLQTIANAANVKGVVFIFQGFEAGLATLQNLRSAIARLQAAGKEVIVYTPYLDLPHYFAASAADRIIAPPSAEFAVLGLRTEVTYLKNALQKVGMRADVVQISPYKTAGNRFSNAEMTPEEKEQLDWLLDEQFEMLVEGMAHGRSQTPETITEHINHAPYFATQAMELGLIDHVAYEDDLPALLAELGKGDDKPPKANLQTWDKTAPLLLEKFQRRQRKFIGVVSLEGSIVMGSSRNPPVDLPIPFVGGQMAGEQTLVQLLRQAEQDANMAALIFHVDSGGGSALASDLIARQIARIGRKKPVLVYMGNVAASGGYYVSAPAQHIMCQSGTITGSIGVINARISSQELYRKLHLNPVHLDRGERAGLYRNNAPMTEEEYQVFWDSIVTIYDQFKGIVSDGRSLPIDELDPICEGRVWSGRQAFHHKLVDSHGDFVDAVRQAAEMAGLPTDESHTIPVHNFYPKDDTYHAAPSFESTALTEIARTLLGETWQDWNGRALLLMPYHIRLH